MFLRFRFFSCRQSLQIQAALSHTPTLLIPPTTNRSYGTTSPRPKLDKGRKQPKRPSETGKTPPSLPKKGSTSIRGRSKPRRRTEERGERDFGLLGKKERAKRKKSISEYPAVYERRIEGLIEPTGKPILRDVQTSFPQPPISKLEHGLDRVLFNPGVHWLRDPHSRVYNYTPWLESIPSVTDFAFERLSGFTASSGDKELSMLLDREDKMFAGSTSSLTGMLSQIYFLISDDKLVDTRTLSCDFLGEPRSFTPGQRMPSSVCFAHRNGRYAIDSDPGANFGFAEKNILTWMGTLLENFLTMAPEEFMSFMRSSPEPEKVDSIKDSYRYAKSDKFIMRAQLDCRDGRLPGTGIFDIKTRACLPVRLDLLNFQEHWGYLIHKQYGILRSFEKEYYDLIRSAFLKYIFQARIGNMDGVFLTYHNTARLFGFQYVPLKEMEDRLFGPHFGVGDYVFETCVRLLEVICQEIVKCFPGKSVKCTFETMERSNKLNVWVEPEDWDEGERPIAQLRVEATSFLGTLEMPGNQAITKCIYGNDKWSVYWRLFKLSDEPNVIRAALEGAKERQFRAFSFPTGVDSNQMSEFWENLNFGGGKTESQVAYKVENFRQASTGVRLLRKMSRAGKQISDRIAAREAGKPKIVFGQSEPWIAPIIKANGVTVKEVEKEG